MEYWCFNVTAVVIITTIAVIWYALRCRYFQLGFMIPGPSGIHLLKYCLRLMFRTENFLAFFEELQQRYGPVFKMFIGPYLFVVLTDPRDIAIILNSKKSLSKAIFYKPIRLLMWTSLAVAETNKWKRLRKVLNPFFTNHIVDGYVDTFNRRSKTLADTLEKHSGKEPFDVREYVMMCELSIITETSLGLNETLQEHELRKLVINIMAIPEKFAYALFRPWLWFLRITSHLPIYKAFTTYYQHIQEFVNRLVNDKTDVFLNSIKRVSECEVQDHGKYYIERKPLDCIEHMLSEITNKPKSLTAEELRDQAITILLGGTDTSTIAVSCTLMLLGLHQDVQMKVMMEQEEIFGDDIHRSVTTRDLKRMVYLEQVINETMRLYPVVPIIGRFVDQDIAIGGYKLPRGTTVVIPITLAHRNSDYFIDPYLFDPDRFNVDSSLERPSHSFIPFSSGRRMCIGKYFAYTSMKIMLSVVLRKFEILEYGSRDDMEVLDFEVVLKLVNGYYIKLQSRKWQNN